MEVAVLGPQLPSSDYGLMLADGRDRDTAWQRVAEAIGVQDRNDTLGNSHDIHFGYATLL
jgi:hypothetical protein